MLLLHIVILISVIFISLIFKYYILKYQLFKSNLLEGIKPIIRSVNTTPITDEIEHAQNKIIDLDDQIIQIENELSNGNTNLDQKHEIINKLNDDFSMKKNEIINLTQLYSFLPDRGEYKKIQEQNLIDGIQSQIVTEFTP